MALSDTKPLTTLLEELLSIPTVSYKEHHILNYIRQFAVERDLEFKFDRFGNAYIFYNYGDVSPPLVLQAHTDHPAFVVDEISKGKLGLKFFGGLSAQYGIGEEVKIYGEDLTQDGVVATIEQIQSNEHYSANSMSRIVGAIAKIESVENINVGDIGIWNIEPFFLKKKLIHALQCDDLIGCAIVLSTIDRMLSGGYKGNVIGLFTRAEEVGLEGAAASAVDGLVPKNSLVISIETSSSEDGRAKQGHGAIIRVGDKQHIFSPKMSMWMTSMADRLKNENNHFLYQRKLMDAGSTEATAFDLLGFETGAVCIALGNWHNAGKGKIEAETVHIDDVQNLILLCEELAKNTPNFFEVHKKTVKAWKKRALEVSLRLIDSAKSTP
ncbi:MAG: hypothetical protein CL792_02895 [Chloroflexi bacterium]|nr:hypothetical protein [Chloroflexota bacterium]|tara:strand:+ start:493 stop:1638 length:1146 start_codon:yes stop_codon:yes gene_type:complete